MAMDQGKLTHARLSDEALREGLQICNDQQVLAYVDWRLKMESATNRDLAVELLAASPFLGKLGDLVEIAAERLHPGIIDELASESAPAAEAAAPPSAPV